MCQPEWMLSVTKVPSRKSACGRPIASPGQQQHLTTTHPRQHRQQGDAEAIWSIWGSRLKERASWWRSRSTRGQGLRRGDQQRRGCSRMRWCGEQRLQPEPMQGATPAARSNIGACLGGLLVGMVEASMARRRRRVADVRAPSASPSREARVSHSEAIGGGVAWRWWRFVQEEGAVRRRRMKAEEAGGSRRSSWPRRRHREEEKGRRGCRFGSGGEDERGRKQDGQVQSCRDSLTSRLARWTTTERSDGTKSSARSVR
jgi:hypothetical protein